MQRLKMKVTTTLAETLPAVATARRIKTRQTNESCDAFITKIAKAKLDMPTFLVKQRIEVGMTTILAETFRDATQQRDRTSLAKR